ncbi:MAG: WecB/TagA/CpsF family glycosyltransferase [Candidatus Udaeobacter sp.]
MWTIGQDIEWETLLEPPSTALQKPVIPVIHQSPKRSPIAILGVPFDSLGLTGALAEIEKMIASGRAHYVVTANVDFLVQARQDMELRRILIEADLALCDGTPLLWASRWLGNPLPERVAGADLVPRLIEIAALKEYRLFFLGGKPEVTAQAVGNLERQYPGLRVTGYSPPFRPLLEMPNADILRRIREAKPDVLLVSFGCPKAEKWMAMHYQSLGVPVVIGVGGTIDFLAGNLKRAPVWMQQSGVEWLFRLFQEPRRLARRYGSDLWDFSRAILTQWWTLQGRPRRARPTPPISALVVEPNWQRLRVPERFDLHGIGRAVDVCEQGKRSPRHCLLEMGNVKFIDSTALALLVRLDKELRRAGRRLVLLEPSREVQRALKLMRLDAFFLVAADVLEARQVIQASTQEPVAPVALAGLSSHPSLAAWQGEITRHNVRRVWRLTKMQIEAMARWRKDLVIELSAVRFIDSAGIGLMLRAKKEAERLGATLTFTRVPPAVQNALERAELDIFCGQEAA